jgi:putative flippase GtrA
MVGGWNTVFGYGAFALLYYFLSGRIHPTIILTFSYILSITNAYIGYKIFVFKTKGNVLREYFRFYVVYGGAFLINLVLLPIFMNFLMLNAYLSQGLITIMTIVGSYILHKRYTFGG